MEFAHIAGATWYHLPIVAVWLRQVTSVRRLWYARDSGGPERRTIDQPIVVHGEAEDEGERNKGADRSVPQKRPDKEEGGRIDQKH